MGTVKIVGDDLAKKCKDCEKEFLISPADQMYYKSKEWDIPERCLACRKKRRDAKKEIK